MSKQENSQTKNIHTTDVHIMREVIIEPLTRAPVMETVSALEGLRSIIQHWKKAGCCIALVPTMGNLHDGHISLLNHARDIADRTVLSIFVNPIQFGQGEDYDNYPSTLVEDKHKLEKYGLDLLFTPDLEQLYPGGTDVDTRINVPDLSNILCGETRPDHFSGVATVVSKLFINVQPDVALFGEKDYQQLLVIKQMAQDLCMPVDVIGMPIVREHDGLAISSRNAYLTNEERKTAPQIYTCLNTIEAQLRQGNMLIDDVEKEAMDMLAEAGFKPEYVSIRRTVDLKQPSSEDKQLSILAAAWLGSARLIDNIKIDLNKPVSSA